MSALARLAWLEVRALPRGRWALVAYAGWTALVSVATALILASEGPALHSFLVLVLVMPALTLMPLAAGALAGDRASRFAQAVFTAPVRRIDHYLAKVLAMLALGVALLAPIAPILWVHAVHGGVPALAWRFLAVAGALVVASVALGALLGVLFAGRSASAAVGAGAAFAVLSGVVVLVLPIAAALPDAFARRILLGLVHATPLSLAFDAAGLHGFVEPASPARSAVALATLALGALALGAWTYARLQAAETWEATRGRATLLAAALVLLALAPAALAGGDYAPGASSGRVVATTGEGAPMLLLPRGGDLDEHAFSQPFPADTALDVDLVVFLKDAPARLPGLSVALSGNATLLDAPTTVDVAPEVPNVSRAYARIPIRLVLSGDGTLGRTPIVVRGVFGWDDASGGGRREVHGEAMTWVKVDGATGQLLAGTSVFPLAALAASGARRWRQR